MFILHCILELLLFVCYVNGVCEDFTTLCAEQTTCRDCITAHYCCNWCQKPISGGFRCFTDQNQNGCPTDSLLTNTNTYGVPLIDDDFTDIQSDPTNVIQMRPQQIEVKLHRNQPINMTIRFRSARNFPLDLYYLMDLTYSMRKDLDTLEDLGEELGMALQDLTKNYRLAFGSYMDKTGMPFYPTDPIGSINPCRLSQSECVTGYSFKHQLNFTDNVQKFMEIIGNSKITANYDNLEGGLDALYQIILCDSQLLWRENSRKIVLIATESAMHMAGDGLLLGAIVPPPRKCRINHDGTVDGNLLYDYPSIEEIHGQLSKRKINVIFAAKNNSQSYYRALHNTIPDSTFVGVLEKQSTNIIELVRDGYYDFAKRLILTPMAPPDGVSIKFFVDCHGNGVFIANDRCINVEEGKMIEFRLEFLLEKQMNHTNDVMFIENDFNEKIQINLEYLGSKCLTCANTTNEGILCVNGDLICGACMCYEGWTGKDCNENCDLQLDSCRKNTSGIISTTCFSNGNCWCGRCICNLPYAGRYCEYACPLDVRRRAICGGIERGTCIEGACVCEWPYNGTDCSCTTLQNKCQAPDVAQICNGHGECRCNHCHCDTGYSGEFCERCATCNGLCNIYIECIRNFIHNHTKECINRTDIEMNTITNIDDNTEICNYEYHNEQQTCNVRYTYNLNRDGVVRIELENPVCSQPIPAQILAASIIIPVLLVGILSLLAWRALTYYSDRREYQRFEKELNSKQFHTESNPLYRTPISHYANPIEMTTFDDKN